MLVRLAIRNVCRNPKRSFLTLLAIAVGLGASIGLAGIARGVSSRLRDNAINTLTGHGQIHSPQYLVDPSVDESFIFPDNVIVSALEQEKDVRQWSSRVRVPAVVMSERNSTGVFLIGIHPDKERGLSFIEKAITDGQYFETSESPGIIVGKALLEKLETGLGKKVVVYSQGADGKLAEIGVRIVGVYRAELEGTELGFAFMSISNVQGMLKLEGKVSEISYRIKNYQEALKVAAKLQQELPALEVSAWTEIEPLAAAMLKIQDGFLVFCFLIVIVAVSFGLVNTMFMAIFERKREIGLLKSLGMKSRTVIGLITLESLALLVVGALFGNLLGFSIALIYRNGLDLSQFAKGGGIVGFGHIIYPVLLYRDIVTANILVFVVGLVGCLYPAIHGVRVKITDALARI